MNHNTRRIEAYIRGMVLAAVISTGYATWESHTLHPYYALAILALAAVTSRIKVKLPGVNGNMSVNMPFLLLAVVNLSAAEAVAIACVSTMVQTWPRRDAKFKEAATDGIQCEHDGVRNQRSELDMAGGLDGEDGMGIRATDDRFSHGHFLSGANRASRGHHQTDRRSGSASNLDEYRATVIPLLRSKRRHDLHVEYGEPSRWVADSASGVPCYVWDPPFLQTLFRKQSRICSPKLADKGSTCRRLDLCRRARRVPSIRTQDGKQTCS